MPVIRPTVRFICQLGRKFMEIITGISLPPDCFVGEGLYVGHFGTIIISPNARIGSNCNLSQGVTLGFAGRGEKGGYPTIGNRVYIATNAVVVGMITVGDDAVIGAGAVVTKSVSPRAVMVGNPAQVISYKGSFDFVKYDGMEHDPERLVSLMKGQEDGRDNAALCHSTSAKGLELTTPQQADGVSEHSDENLSQRRHPRMF